jgi:surface protein
MGHNYNKSLKLKIKKMSKNKKRITKKRITKKRITKKRITKKRIAKKRLAFSQANKKYKNIRLRRGGGVTASKTKKPGNAKKNNHYENSKINKPSKMTDETIHKSIGDWIKGIKGAKDILGPIGDWDVSEVTNMSNLFNNRRYFNEDLSKWNVSKVIDMGSMFFSAESFNNGANAFDKGINGWDVSKVTNMANMFGDARIFNREIGDWNIKNVTRMDGMFFHPTLDELESVELPILDDLPPVDNVTCHTIPISSGAFCQNLSNWIIKDDKTNRVDMFMTESYMIESEGKLPKVISEGGTEPMIPSQAWHLRNHKAFEVVPQS